MVVRLWSARTTRQLSNAYVEYFSQHVLPELQSVPGYVATQVLTSPVGDTVQILVLTLWQSFEAIAAFAGQDREAAVVHPGAAALLTEYDHRVRHFDLAVFDPPQNGGGKLQPG